MRILLLLCGIIVFLYKYDFHLIVYFPNKLTVTHSCPVQKVNCNPKDVAILYLLSFLVGMLRNYFKILIPVPHISVCELRQHRCLAGKSPHSS